MQNLVPLLLIVFFLLTGCSQPVEIEGFDAEGWKGDPMACEGQRAKMQEDILAASEALKGLTSREIMSVLGKPNKEELYQRSQKFFIYYLEPGPQCHNTSQGGSKVVFIRFSALNIANEVFIREY